MVVEEGGIPVANEDAQAMRKDFSEGWQANLFFVGGTMGGGAARVLQDKEELGWLTRQSMSLHAIAPFPNLLPLPWEAEKPFRIQLSEDCF